MKKISTYLCFVLLPLALCSFIAFTTTWSTTDARLVAKELKELSSKLATVTHYSVSVNYNTYTSHQSNEVHDRSRGYVLRYGNCAKTSLMGIYTVQNEQYRVTIDSANRLVKVANAFENAEPVFSYNDYIKILGFCKSVKKSFDKTQTGYRFETKNTEGLLAQEIFLENGVPRRVYIYYSNEHSWRENNVIKKETVYPKLNVMFGDFNQKIACTAGDFSIDKIVIKKDKKFQLAPGYAAFKLIDSRIKQ